MSEGRDHAVVSVTAHGGGRAPPRARRHPAQHLRDADPSRREVIPRTRMQSFRAITHDFPSEICGWGSPPRVRDPPHHQDPRQLHRGRPHRHLRARPRRAHGPEPAARLGQRPRAGTGGARPRRRRPVQRRVDPRVHGSHARAARSLDELLKRVRPAASSSPAPRRGGPPRRSCLVSSSWAEPDRAPVQAAQPVRRGAGRTSARSWPASGWGGPPTARSQRGRRGRTHLHLRQPHRRHPPVDGGPPRLHVRADVLQVLQGRDGHDLQSMVKKLRIAHARRLLDTTDEPCPRSLR